MCIKDARTILHLQGILQAILKDPNNFETEVSKQELKVIEGFRKDADNTFVIGAFAKKHRKLSLRLIDNLGEKIPPATQEIESLDETRYRNSGVRHSSSWAA